MIELERTFLAKSIPQGIKDGEEMIDIYVPTTAEHPILRIRKKDDFYEITKKKPVIEGDSSKLSEETIMLSEAEFQELEQVIGKRVYKTRYKYLHKDKTAEIDVFQGRLHGLVLIDFEFHSEEEKNSFEMPDFCLAEVTQDEVFAGGKLCGKSYEDIVEKLEKYSYKKINFF